MLFGWKKEAAAWKATCETLNRQLERETRKRLILQKYMEEMPELSKYLDMAALVEYGQEKLDRLEEMDNEHR